MPFPWIDKSDLEHRIGPKLLRRIYDDNEDGVTDDDPVARLLSDACSFVAGGLGTQYTVDSLTAAASVPAEIIRITLDVAEAYAAKRHPRIVQRDWKDLMEEARLDIKQIRSGSANLGTTGAPEPSEQSQGEFYLQGESDEDDQPSTFTRSGFGSF